MCIYIYIYIYNFYLCVLHNHFVTSAIVTKYLLKFTQLKFIISPFFFLAIFFFTCLLGCISRYSDYRMDWEIEKAGFDSRKWQQILLSVGSRPALGPPIENVPGGYLRLHSAIKYGLYWLHHYLTLYPCFRFFDAFYHTII